MRFSTIQKKIIKDIVKYKKKESDVLFRELFEVIFKNITTAGIEISNNNVEIFSNNIIEDKEKIYELFFLLEILIKENYINLIKTDLNCEMFEEKYYFNKTVDNSKKINLPQNLISLVYSNLYSDFYISGSLRDLAKSLFMTVEERNLWITLLGIYLTVFVNIFGFFLQWHIATKVNTVIEFANFENLRYIAELIKHLNK